MTEYNYRYYTKYNTGTILGTFGSWVACNAPFILTPLFVLNLIILISILVTSVLQSWYSANVSSINNVPIRTWGRIVCIGLRSYQWDWFQIRETGVSWCYTDLMIQNWRGCYTDLMIQNWRGFVPISHKTTWEYVCPAMKSPSSLVTWNVKILWIGRCLALPAMTDGFGYELVEFCTLYIVHCTTLSAKSKENLRNQQCGGYVRSVRTLLW